MKTLFTLLGMLVFGSILAQDKIYLHQATPSNISGHITYIDHPDLDGNPNANLVFIQNWNGNGLGGEYNDNPVGLFYDAGLDGGKWSVFNENSVAMPENAKFNIFIADDSEVYTHIATPANTSGNLTNFDIPAINEFSFVTFSTYWNPNGVYNPHPYGTFWFGGERGLYIENGVPIPEGAAFKVMRATSTSATSTTHTSAAANITANFTIIDHPDLNGNPDATFVYSHYFGFGGAYQEDVPFYTGAWYDGSNWSIFLQDTSAAFPEGVLFDIVIADQEVLSTSNFEQVQATLFPNPAIDILNVQANSGLQKIIIYNLLGQEVFKQTLENDSATLDVSTLSSGQYIATITTQNGVANQKFIKK